MKILAIDDNADNLTTLKAVVSDKLPGTRLLTALNGLEGIELARVEDPDVILLDIVMPGMDGYEVCRKLKQDGSLKTIPVLFLTALRADRDSRIKGLEAGAEGFLSKPVDEIELTAQIRAMVKIKAAALMQRDDNKRLAGLVAERTRALQQSQAATLKLLDELKAENEARKHGEQALRQRESVLQKIFEILPIGLWFADRNGKLLRGNPAGVAIWGAEPKVDLANYGVFKARRLPSGQELAPEDWALARTVREGVTVVDELLEIDAFDGKKKTILNYTAPVIDEAGTVQGAIVVNQDITERKRAEEQMETQLEELRRWQAVTLGREGRIDELKNEVNALAAKLGEKPPYGGAEASNGL
ncbi:MAG: response regulator [Kiritimatiellia bacterium]